MSFTEEVSKRTLVGDGVAVAFDYNFLIYSSSHLAVYLDGVLQSSGFTVSGVGIAAGGTVTFDTAPANGVIVTLNLEVPFTQELKYNVAGKFPSASHEQGLDLNAMLCKRLKEVDSRALLAPLGGDTLENLALPSQTNRASKYLAFDASGNPVATAGTTSVIVASTYAETLIDDADAPTARGTLGFPTIAAKGDLIVGTAANTLDKLAVGSTTGHVLVVDPSTTTGLGYGHRAMPNPIINGNMEVWQRGTLFTNPPSTSYGPDRFLFRKGGSMVYDVRRSTNVPTVGQAGVLFNYALEVDVTTADAVVDAADLVAVEQKIEGYNWRHFAQRQFTISFWVLSTKTGTHCLSLSNLGNDKAYIAEYTVSASNTWEFKSITIPASPSAGSWGDYTNSTGLQVRWALMVGSNAQDTAGSWLSSSNKWGTSNQVNVMDNTSNFFRLTGVKLELGSIATPIVFSPFEEELQRCMRYYQKSFPYGTTPAQNAGLSLGGVSVPAVLTTTGANRVSRDFAVPMRAAPTMVTYNPSAANVQARDENATADCSSTATTPTEKGFLIGWNGNASSAVGNRHTVYWTADAEL